MFPARCRDAGSTRAARRELCHGVTVRPCSRIHSTTAKRIENRVGEQVLHCADSATQPVQADGFRSRWVYAQFPIAERGRLRDRSSAQRGVCRHCPSVSDDVRKPPTRDRH